VVDHLADVWHFDRWSRDGDAVSTTGMVAGVKTRLLKPQTYMNLSGAVLRPYVRRPFWSAVTDLLVIVDDVALPLGTFRLRAQGSAGGHNGLKSIEGALGTRDYPRLRVGIRPPENEGDAAAAVAPGGPLTDFVLAPFRAAERDALEELQPRLRGAVESWLANGIQRAMTEFNTAAQ